MLGLGWMAGASGAACAGGPAMVAAVLAGVTLKDVAPVKTLTLIGLFFLCWLVFYLWERWGERVVEEQPPGPFRRGWLGDFTSALAHGPFMAACVEIAGLMMVMSVPAVQGWAPLAEWHVVPAFLLYFLVNDFCRYWLHRWYHESDLLWRFHRVHHSATELGILVNFRLHLLEALPKFALLVLPFKLLGISPLVLVVYSTLDLIKGLWHHANVKTYVGVHNLWLNSAEQHWWHHSVEARGQNANYGSTLSVWDRMFGTFYWPRGQWPTRVGVEGLDRFPQDYLGQLVSVVKPDSAFDSSRQSGPPAQLQPPSIESSASAQALAPTQG